MNIYIAALTRSLLSLHDLINNRLGDRAAEKTKEISAEHEKKAKQEEEENKKKAKEGKDKKWFR